MAALQAGINGREQADWLASLRLDPPEEDRADVRHALLAALLVKVLGGRDVPPARFLDDLPWRERISVGPDRVTFRKRMDAAMRAFASVGRGRR